jgi:hypothetical protein
MYIKVLEDQIANFNQYHIKNKLFNPVAAKFELQPIEKLSELAHKNLQVLTRINHLNPVLND